MTLLLNILRSQWNRKCLNEDNEIQLIIRSACESLDVCLIFNHAVTAEPNSMIFGTEIDQDVVPCEWAAGGC